MRPTRLSLIPPHRMDLDAAWLARAALSLLRVRQATPNDDFVGVEGLTFLSVRSSLCALLASVDWEPGSEVLVSAMTITDMPKLIAAFGFVPVAVDIDPRTLAPDLAELKRRIGPKTRAVLVAHLFGARSDLDPVARLAERHGLMLIEDAAQAFVGPAWRGHASATVTLFSFGTLKTLTALGGGVAVVRDPVLRENMRRAQASWPQQSRTAFGSKVLKAALFLFAQQPLVYGLIAHVLALMGRSINEVLRKATRGFPARDVTELRSLLERRPHPALVAFLHARIAGFRPARLDARRRAGERLRAAFPTRQPGAHAQLHTHWAAPLEVRDVEAMRAALWRAGIDGSGASNMTAIGGARAQQLLRNLVFVPAYPELGGKGLEQVMSAVERELARVDAALLPSNLPLAA
ncbi:MAG: DegT/DnrJ/EryC1/StrS aminotransferase family protein [Deltaproteobacteria bacterium]|nr:DegT/DnrJ/EryC1/StrS aminotransferase family protein [Deltaproteobacteria bacterium]